MTIEELLKNGKLKLIENNIEDSSLISKILLEYVLKEDRNNILKEIKNEIEIEKIIEYENLIEKIIEGIPLQYITKNQEFMKLSFYVDEKVLIPQPDTEILVEEVISIAMKEKKDKILDICSGSGAIGVSLAYYLEKSKITLSDISKDALNVAKKNVIKNNVKDKVKFIQSNMFNKIENKFDIIVSNPPYIETDVIQTLSEQVRKEPNIALDGGKDGLDFYKILIEEAPKFLEDSGYLCMEIGYDQKEKIIDLIEKSKKYKKVYSKKDLSGNDRIVICNL